MNINLIIRDYSLVTVISVVIIWMVLLVVFVESLIKNMTSQAFFLVIKTILFTFVTMFLMSIIINFT